MSAAFLPAPRRQHRLGGAARRPGGGAGPPAPRPALPRPTLRGRGAPPPRGRAARGSTQRPHGDRRLSPGEGRGRGRPGQRRPGSSEAAEPPRVVPPSSAVLRLDSAAFCSRLRPRGERQAAAGGEGLCGRQEQRRPGASADVTPVLKTVFHRQSQ